MSDKFTDLKHQYQYQVPAAALLINAGRPALRVECPEIGKEFTDNAYIGTDPEGYLYYNHISSFNSDRKVHYKVTRLVNPYDKKVCCWVQFYAIDANDCHAEFLAYDTEETVKGCAMDNFCNVGQWADLVEGSATATVVKYDDNNTISITVTPIRKKATFDSGEVLKDKDVDHVQGLLYFKDINNIGKGVFANYNNDRIVFFESSWDSTNFVAYFIPYESNTNSLGLEANKSNQFENIKWSSI